MQGILLGPAGGTSTSSRPAARDVLHQAEVTAAYGRMAHLMSQGECLERAMLDSVDALSRLKERPAARGLAEAVGRVTGGERAPRLADLLIAANRRQWELAFHALSELADDDLARFLPVQAITTCLHVGTPPARARAEAIAGRSASMSPSTLVQVATRFLVVDDRATAARLSLEVHERGVESLGPRDRHQLDALDAGLSPAPVAPPPDGVVQVGVMSHHHPDRSRAPHRVEDQVQTLAMLGHLARFSECSYSGDEGLAELMGELQGRVRPELVDTGPSGRVHLVPFSRDHGTGDNLQGPVWAVAFGWHMHSLRGLRYDFPYHPAVRPIFVSFHVNRPRILTEEALQYLRANGPVGCRDWTTVDLLLSAGVDAFFTGCLTTSVDALFGDRPADVERAPTGLVDVPKRLARGLSGPSERVPSGDLDARSADLAGGVRAALQLLERYQQYSSLVTSRLDAYLSATSLGVPVRFRPADRSDVRLEGLTGMRPGGPRLVRMRDEIRALLGDILSLVVAGADEDVVRERWRELTASRADAARTRLERGRALPVIRRPSVTEDLARTRSLATRYGPHEEVDPDEVTDVALSLDQNLRRQLPVTLEALVTNASGPLRMWITCRGLSADYQEWLAAAFPRVPLTFLPCDHVEYRDPQLFAHITTATMDRLLIADLLPELDRITYLDIDAVVLADVCRLARTDLRGRPLAARSAGNLAAERWWGAQLPPERAFELRRLMAARHAFGATTFNAGVLVLDLARLRADRFTETWVPFAEEYTLSDQAALLAYAGGDRVDLDPRWNAWPDKEPVQDPWIVHYLGAEKPWLCERTPMREYWQQYEDAFAARCSQLPG